MDTEWIVAGIVGFIILTYLYLTWNYSYWKKRGVPQLPKQFPGVGDFLDVVLQKRGIENQLTEIHKKFEGHKIGGYYRFRQPALVVRDPQLIKKVLIHDFSSFHDNAIYIDEKTDPVIAKNPFVARGSRWKTIRGQITPTFTTAKFRSLFPLVKENFKYLNKYINDYIGQNIEAKKMAAMFAVDNVASIAYGLEGGSFNKESQHLYKHGVELMGQAFEKPWLLILVCFFPKLVSLLKLRMVSESSVKYFESLIKQTEEYRQKNNITRNDFLQMLLNIRKESQKTGQEYSYEDIIAHCLTFFMDGYETSSTMASFALYEVAINPNVQDKLRDEFLSVTSKGNEIDYDTLISLPYLDKVVSETLRKYCGFALSKVCTKDTTLEVDGKCIPIEKGTPVTLSLHGLHHNPEYFENPDVFDPERFSEENIALRPPDTYIPFGGGPRICLGMRFGVLQIKSFLFNIVSNYRLLRCERTVDKLVFDKFYILPRSVDGLWMKIEKL